MRARLSKLDPKKRAMLMAEARKHACACKGKGCKSCS